jgi:hypothetical protein
MNKTLCVITAGCTLLTAGAAEYPLQFKTIEAKDVMSFPGGYGTYGQIRLKKPTDLQKEPEVKSKKPLYGVFNNKPDEMIFRLDESKGNEKGYDQLIIDINRNGDLTDDPVMEIAPLPKDVKNMPVGKNYPFFGPLELPAARSVAGGRPRYYAQAYIYVTDLKNIPADQEENLYLGQLRLRAAWYLETEIDAAGSKRKIAIMDGNASMTLGDTSTPMTYQNGDNEPKSWYFRPGDVFLVDEDKSGTFERGSFERETAPFNSILYIGPNAFKVTPSANFASVQVAPWSDALAEVTMQPCGEQIRSLALAREVKADQWELIKVWAEKGKIRVPPGNYRLYGCQIMAANAQNEMFAAEGMLREFRKPSAFAVDSNNTLKCGAPLQIKATATKRKPESYEDNRLGAKGDKDSEFVLTVNSTVVGQGGEVYSTYGQGAKLQGLKNKPTVAIADSDGKTLKNGNMEFG